MVSSTSDLTSELDVNYSSNQTEKHSTLMSPDILAAQQSLSFLQGLEEDTDGGNQAHSFDLKKSVDANTSLRFNDSFYETPPVLGSTFSSSGSLLDEPLPSDIMSSLPSLEPTEGRDFATDEKFAEATSLSLPTFLGSGNSSTSSSPRPSFVNTQQSQSNLKSESSTSYTGFTVQGGKIPSIPCETGYSHGSLSSPRDPLSPPFGSSHPSLPPPLLPTSSAETRSEWEAEHKRNKNQSQEDTVDRVVNVLGDIVETFDNLL